MGLNALAFVPPPLRSRPASSLHAIWLLRHSAPFSAILRPPLNSCFLAGFADVSSKLDKRLMKLYLATGPGYPARVSDYQWQPDLSLPLARVSAAVVLSLTRLGLKGAGTESLTTISTNYPDRKDRREAFSFGPFHFIFRLLHRSALESLPLIGQPPRRAARTRLENFTRDGAAVPVRERWRLSHTYALLFSPIRFFHPEHKISSSNRRACQRLQKIIGFSCGL